MDLDAPIYAKIRTPNRIPSRKRRAICRESTCIGPPGENCATYTSSLCLSSPPPLSAIVDCQLCDEGVSQFTNDSFHGRKPLSVLLIIGQLFQCGLRLWVALGDNVDPKANEIRFVDNRLQGAATSWQVKQLPWTKDTLEYRTLVLEHCDQFL